MEIMMIYDDVLSNEFYGIINVTVKISLKFPVYSVAWRQITFGTSLQHCHYYTLFVNMTGSSKESQEDSNAIDHTHFLNGKHHLKIFSYTHK